MDLPPELQDGFSSGRIWKLPDDMGSCFIHSCLVVLVKGSFNLKTSGIFLYFDGFGKTSKIHKIHLSLVCNIMDSYGCAFPTDLYIYIFVNTLL